MERNTFLGVLLVTLLALGIGLLIPIKQDANRPEMLPWAIKVNSDGSSTVFGLTLGRSTLGDAERQFLGGDELTMFRSAKGRLSVESYFDDVILSGLGARIVLEVRLSDQELMAIYNRGLRIANMGNGRSKITMQPDDVARVRATPISSITYLPKASLSPDMIAKRFGEPAQKITEPGGNEVHWLYPAKGVDVALSPSGKAVLLYVAPKDFARVTGPLMAKAAVKH